MIAIIITIFVMIYLILTPFYYLFYNDDLFNPITNYEKWNDLNWVGVWTITILIIIIFLPFFIIHLLFKLLYWMFTVGR